LLAAVVLRWRNKGSSFQKTVWEFGTKKDKKRKRIPNKKKYVKIFCRGGLPFFK
jgi:hypothetical protein